MQSVHTKLDVGNLHVVGLTSCLLRRHSGREYGISLLHLVAPSYVAGVPRHMQAIAFRRRSHKTSYGAPFLGCCPTPGAAIVVTAFRYTVFKQPTLTIGSHHRDRHQVTYRSIILHHVRHRQRQYIAPRGPRHEWTLIAMVLAIGGIPATEQYASNPTAQQIASDERQYVSEATQDSQRDGLGRHEGKGTTSP